MKRFVLAILFVLMTTQLAFCETATFRVGATIPRIIGVNYFPDSEATRSDMKTDITKQLAMRDGKEILLQTSIVK